MYLSQLKFLNNEAPMNYYNTVIYHKKYELRNIFYLSANIYLSKILTIFFCMTTRYERVCVGTRGVIYMFTYVHSVYVSACLILL